MRLIIQGDSGYEIGRIEHYQVYNRDYEFGCELLLQRLLDIDAARKRGQRLIIDERSDVIQAQNNLRG